MNYWNKLQIVENKSTLYKVLISILFGLIGFFLNFQSIIFPFGDYNSAILLGLFFPLIITLSWGWRYGLLSALAGGCQSMWWLWGSSNGYAIFLVVPPFTLWIIWHGIFVKLRSTLKSDKLWLNPYIIEIPFRILSSLNLLFTSRWAVSFNPTPWDWGANSSSVVNIDFSIFVVFKQAIIAFILLLIADVLLHLSPVRKFFMLSKSSHSTKTGYIISASLLFGCFYWVFDSIIHVLLFNKESSFIDLLARDIPKQNLFTRLVVFLFCIIFGMFAAKILRQQKKDESNLILSEKKFRGIFNQAAVGVARVSLDGKWLEVNNRVCEMYGYSEEELLKARFFDVKHPEDLETDLQKLIPLFKGDIEKLSLEVRNIKKNGQLIWVNLSISLMRDKNDLPDYLIAMMEDITDKKNSLIDKDNLESRLNQAQKMEALGTLAGGIAHDFNNILAIMLGYASAMKYDIPTDSELMNPLNQILVAGNRAKELVKQILAFSRKTNVERIPLKMDLIIKESLRMIRASIPTTISITKDIDPDCSFILADPTQAHQIIVNLCTNAFHAMENNGGTLSVSLRNISIDHNSLNIIPGEYIKMSVSDTGAGINSVDIKKIFDPYFTTKDVGKGTGMGLAIIHGIIKDYGGEITVESILGNGTTFSIYLPAFVENIIIDEQENSEIPHGTERLLFVDDEELLVSCGINTLRRLGYHVTGLSSSREALKVFINNPNQFDLVITDQTMPDLTGSELAYSINQIRSDIPIILCTGYSQLVDSEKVKEVGIKEIALKPISIQVLAQLIRSVLDK